MEIQQPVKVLVTIQEPCKPLFKKGTAQALLAALRAKPLSASTRYSDTEIEKQIQEARDSWE